MLTIPTRNPAPTRSHSPFPPKFPSPESYSPMSVSTDLPPLDGSYEWNHTIGGLLCLNLSLSIMFSSCIHVVECIGTHFFLLLNNIPLSRHTTFFFISSLVGRRLGCFCFWLSWIMLLWTVLYKFYMDVFFNFLGYILRSGISGSCDNSVFNILMLCQTVFQNSCTLLHSH